MDKKKKTHFTAIENSAYNDGVNNFKEAREEQRLKIGVLQRKASEVKLPIIIIFEGVSGAGKGSLVNELIINLDPRLMKFSATHSPREEERLRPFLWTYWKGLPQKGTMSILYRSWYSRLIYYKLKKNLKALNRSYQELIQDINSFERTLSDEGYLIIKFFLHIDKKTHKEEIKKLKEAPLMKWKAEEYKEVDYEKYSKTIQGLIHKTNTLENPWYILNTEDKKSAILQMYKVIEERINKAINKGQEKPLLEEEKLAFVAVSKDEEDNNKDEEKKYIDIRSISLNKTLSKVEYKEKVKFLQGRLRELQYALYKERIALIILYEGWDAAGKGGNIKRLIKDLDPTGYEVIPIAIPNVIEREHHYLWRFWTKIPKSGHIAIFDRSWYGRVLVERVEGFITSEQWNRAYGEINNMEKTLTSSNTILIKLFLHIDKEEQLQRFKVRESDPHKMWKITEEDYRNREKWEDYVIAINEMIDNTSTEYAPWNIVEGNCKSYARIKALEIVINIIEDKLKHKHKLKLKNEKEKKK